MNFITLEIPNDPKRGRFLQHHSNGQIPVSCVCGAGWGGLVRSVFDSTKAEYF